LLAGLIICAIATQTYCHSYLSTPASRSNQRQSGTGCRGPACRGPCDVTLARAVTPAVTVQRGQTISIKWPRNNHAGGFVRYAWSLTTNSDSAASFDANVQFFSCFEIGALCKPDDSSDPNGGDSGGLDSCGASIVVPGWVTDGKWTLQWAWFGGAFQLGDYYSCVDYTISGGPATAKTTPVLFGGDYANPNNRSVCKYFNTNQLHICIDEPCEAPTAPFPGQHSGPVSGISAALSSGSSSAGSSSGASSSGASSGGASSGDLSGVLDGGIQTVNTDGRTPCVNNTDCNSGICEIDGFCYSKSKSSGLSAGSISAVFFALFFVVVIGVAVAFAVINKSEWPNWRPFNKLRSNA